MKRTAGSIIINLIFFCAVFFVHPAEAVMTVTPYTLTVDGKIITGRVYQDGQVYMVPLRAVAEGLGYDVSWDGERSTATADMSIASMSATVGSTTYTRKGKLKVIDLTMDFMYAAAARIVDGRIYVPAEFFRELCNETSLRHGIFDIAPQRAYLEADSAAH